MSRYTAGASVAILGISCVITLVHGQDGGPREPGLLPLGPDSAQIMPLERVPSSPRTLSGGSSAWGAPAAGLRASAFESSEDAPASASGALRRPSAAERLQQVKESSSGRVTAGISGGRAVTGPVPA